jgi:hypothetical protein
MEKKMKGPFDARTARTLLVGGLVLTALLTSGCNAQVAPTSASMPVATETAPTKSDPFYKENIFFAGVAKETIYQPDLALVLASSQLKSQDGQDIKIDIMFGKIIAYKLSKNWLWSGIYSTDQYNFLWSSNDPRAYQVQQCSWGPNDTERPKGAPSDCGVLYAPGRFSSQQIRYALYPDEAKLVIGWNGDWKEEGYEKVKSAQPFDAPPTPITQKSQTCPPIKIFDESKCSKPCENDAKKTCVDVKCDAKIANPAFTTELKNAKQGNIVETADRKNMATCALDGSWQYSLKK